MNSSSLAAFAPIGARRLPHEQLGHPAHQCSQRQLGAATWPR